MLIYLLATRPFETVVDNVMHICNELLLLLVFVAIAVLNLIHTTADNEELCGIVILVGILLSLIFTWGVFIAKLLKDLLCKKQANPGEKESSKRKVSRRRTMHETGKAFAFSSEIKLEHRVKTMADKRKQKNDKNDKRVVL